jgi:hypothetical protein
MTLEDALRGIARAIARLQTPKERAHTSLIVQQMIDEKNSRILLTLEEAAVCFYPSDKAKADQALATLKQAITSGQIDDSRAPGSVTMGGLDTWQERPPFGDDSPFSYWFANVLVNAVKVLDDEGEKDPKGKRQDDRLERFEDLGGQVLSEHGELKFKGVKPLNQELAKKTAGDPTTIRADLKAAYERRKRKAASAELFKKLSSRTPT